MPLLGPLVSIPECKNKMVNPISAQQGYEEMEAKLEGEDEKIIEDIKGETDVVIVKDSGLLTWLGIGESTITVNRLSDSWPKRTPILFFTKNKNWKSNDEFEIKAHWRGFALTKKTNISDADLWYNSALVYMGALLNLEITTDCESW